MASPNRIPRDMGTALRELGITPESMKDEEIWALCPQHEARTGRADRHASWSVNTETGIHNCFSCGYSGTFTWLVMDLKFQTDMWGALAWIASHGIKLIEPGEMTPYNATRETEEIEQAVTITDASLALFFKPPIAQLDARYITPESSENYELLWDIDRRGWIFPVRAWEGKLLGWQFKSKRIFLNYPPGISKGECLFLPIDLVPGAPVVLVESPLDAARMHSAGVRNVVSSFGAGVTRSQLALCLTISSEIILALDNDAAGWKSMQTIAHGELDWRGNIKKDGWVQRFKDMRYFEYPGGGVKDPGDMTDEQVVAGIDESQSVSALALGPLRNARPEPTPKFGYGPRSAAKSKSKPRR